MKLIYILILYKNLLIGDLNDLNGIIINKIINECIGGRIIINL